MNTNPMQSNHNSFRLIASAAALLLCAAPLAAQTAATIPIPAELLSAHTAFVANAGGPDNYLNTTTYKALYQALLRWNRLQLVDSPRNAELALEVSTGLDSGRVGTSIIRHPASIQLNIRDVKTQSLLWSLSEPIISLPDSDDIKQATSKLVGDFQSLITGKLLNAPPDSKTRFSQEGK